MFNMLNMLNMCNMLNMLNYIIKYFELTANTRPMIFAYYTTVRLSKQRKENGRNHLLIIVIHCFAIFAFFQRSTKISCRN